MGPRNIGNYPGPYSKTKLQLDPQEAVWSQASENFVQTGCRPGNVRRHQPAVHILDVVLPAARVRSWS